MSGNKDRPATGCEAGVVLKFSQSPTDLGTHAVQDAYDTHKTNCA